MAEPTGAPLEGLPSAGALTGAELLYLVQGGNSRKVDLDTVKALFDAQGLDQLRLPAGGEASLASDDHAFQIGDTSGVNLIMDGNEVQCRSNGGAAALNLNPAGGNVLMGGSAFIQRPNGCLLIDDTAAANISEALGYLSIRAGTYAANGTAALFGCLNAANEHVYIRNNSGTASIRLELAGGASAYNFSAAQATFGNARLSSIADPVNGGDVADRDYNDARYARKFHVSTLIETPVENKNYYLCLQIPQDVNINKVSVRTVAGTCTVGMFVHTDASNTFWGNVAASTVENVEDGYTPVLAYAGNKIRIKTSSVSGAQDLTVDILGDYA